MSRNRDSLTYTLFQQNAYQWQAQVIGTPNMCSLSKMDKWIKRYRAITICDHKGKTWENLINFAGLWGKNYKSISWVACFLTKGKYSSMDRWSDNQIRCSEAVVSEQSKDASRSGIVRDHKGRTGSRVLHRQANPSSLQPGSIHRNFQDRRRQSMECDHIARRD